MESVFFHSLPRIFCFVNQTPYPQNPPLEDEIEDWHGPFAGLLNP